MGMLAVGESPSDKAAYGAAALPSVLLSAAVVLAYLSNLTPESLASATGKTLL